MFYNIFYLLIFAFCFIGDRLSKLWAVRNFALEPLVVTDYFSVALTWNRGISWSMFQSDSAIYFWLLTSIIMLVMVTFGVYSFMRYRHGHTIFFEVMVLTGALSNLVDRFWYGAVVDFIELHLGEWYWPTFNVADACIVVGVIGIMIKMVCNSHDDAC